MILKAQYEFLFVGRDEGSFLENYTYELQQPGGGAAQVFLCLEIQNNPGEAESIGEAMFEELKATFFAELEDGGMAEAYLRFENSLKAVNRRMGDFRQGKLNKHIGVVHAIIGAVEQGTLYVSQCGDSEAYLIRKRFVSIVSEGLSDPHHTDGDLFTSIANGELEPGDFVLFATTRLLRYITKMDLSRMVISSNVSRTLADLRDALSGEILGRIGLIGIGTTLVTEDVVTAEDETVAEEGPILQHVAARTPFRSTSGGSTLKTVMAYVKPAMVQAKRYSVLAAEQVRKSEVFSKTGPVARFSSKTMYRLTHEKGVTKVKILVAFIGIIILLVGGIWFAKRGQMRNAELLALDTKLAEARQLISDAEGKGQTDKEAAGVLIDTAVIKAKEVLNTSDYRAKALEILAQAQSTRDLLDNIKHIAEPKVVADLSTQGATNALGMVEIKNQFYVYEAQKLYQVALDIVQKPIEFDAGDPIISGVYFDEKDEPIFFSKAGKLMEFVNGAIRQMTAQEGSFRKGVQIADWGARFYVLDPTSDQIWRYAYVKSKDAFATAEGYKTEGDLKNGAALTIDGNVYVLGERECSLQKRHQKVIEVLLECGADINARTNNDESVLELCDDADVRDFIIQKSTEIEQHQAAAASAALELKMQMQMSNASSSTNNLSSSTNSTLRGTADKSSNGNGVNSIGSSSSAINNSTINSSTRSLKRTSTGVNRSSSVRRSSFRDKEKAARKLDTSFKDVLYASEGKENVRRSSNFD